MDLLDIAKVVGPIVGVLSLAFGVYKFVWTRRTRVRVEGSFAMLAYGPDLKDAIQIKAVNKSAHPIRVDAVGIELQDGSGRTAQPIQNIDGATIPGVVQAHDAGTTWVLVEGTPLEKELDLTEPVRVFVSLANQGDRTYSKPRAFWAKENED